MSSQKEIMDEIRNEHLPELRSLKNQMEECVVAVKGLHADLEAKTDLLMWKIFALTCIGGAMAFACGYFWGSNGRRGGNDRKGNRSGNGGGNN